MMIKIANLLKNLKKNDKGFTLIELMVVIAVLGIMAALIIPQFTNVSDKAQEANAKSTAQAVASAAAMYIADNPGVSDGLETAADAAAVKTLLEPYMSNIDAIQGDYSLTFASGKVTVTGNNGTNKVPNTISAEASYK